jgi:hypothetical protein
MAATAKTAFVLGAGRVAGGAWLLGALSAIEAETGWRPADADYVLGTSAASLIGALLASGVSPELMVAYARGDDIDSPVVTERDFRPLGRDLDPVTCRATEAEKREDALAVHPGGRVAVQVDHCNRCRDPVGRLHGTPWRAARGVPTCGRE